MEAIDLLPFCAAVSLATTGLYVSLQWQGMLLHPLKQRLETKIPAPWNKPLYDCLICMSSVYTTGCWLLLKYPPEWTLLWAILIVAGLNTLVCSLRLDPMPCVPDGEKVLRKQNGGITETDYIISCNATAFVQRAATQHPDFYQWLRPQQLETLRDYALQVQQENRRPL